MFGCPDVLCEYKIISLKNSLNFFFTLGLANFGYLTSNRVRINCESG